MSRVSQKAEIVSRKGATVSPDGVYRFDLWRIWDDARGLVNFVMLNPSTADAKTDDPTIRRCMRFAKDWGFGGLVVTNLFAARTTDPRPLRTMRDPVGPANDVYILNRAETAKLVIVAWGAWAKNVSGGNRARNVLEMLRPYAPHHLERTNNNQPGHPLYIPASTKPARWWLE